MFGRMLLLFVFLPMVELYLLIMLGSRIGAMPTIGLIVFTGVLGATLARQQGLSVLSKIQREMASGKPPTQELVEGALIVVGGIVLLTPGIITDLFGFSLLIPPHPQSILQSPDPVLHQAGGKGSWLRSLLWWALLFSKRFG